MLSVHPARQGEGLARRLVVAAEDWARAAGCTHMDLHVLSQRQELPAFYRHLGYADNGTLPFDEPTKLPYLHPGDEQAAHRLARDPPRQAGRLSTGSLDT